MKQKELQDILQSLNKTDLQIILWRARLHRIRQITLNILHRIDLWLFPPLGFYACYNAISLLFPTNHPMTSIAIPGTAFMFTTLAILLLRRPKKYLHTGYKMSQSNQFDNKVSDILKSKSLRWIILIITIFVCVCCISPALYRAYIVLKILSVAPSGSINIVP